MSKLIQLDRRSFLKSASLTAVGGSLLQCPSHGSTTHWLREHASGKGLRLIRERSPTTICPRWSPQLGNQAWLESFFPIEPTALQPRPEGVAVQHILWRNLLPAMAGLFQLEALAISVPASLLVRGGS